MKIKSRLVLTALLAFSGAIYLSADAQNPSTSDAGRPAKTVEVAIVESAVENRQLRFSGVTRAVQRARLSFALGGRLVDRPAVAGSVVRQGEVLARLDSRELANAVARAKGSLAELVARRGQSERDLERAERLAAAKAATGEEVEQSRAGVEALLAAEAAARAQLKETERLLDETVLRAPFAGTVTETLYEPGEFAVVGRPVVVLSGDGDIELSVEVPESVMPHVQTQDAVRVDLPVLGQQVPGTVKSVARTAMGAGRLFPVLVDIPATSGLAAGSTAELILELSTDDAMTVPVEAVVNPGGHQPSIFRLADAGTPSSVEKLKVEVGSLLGERVIVHGPLRVGDRVVVGGQRGLLDGESVEVRQ